MKTENIKGSSIELPVDRNGNALQILWLGGRTIIVNDSDFKTETNVVRLCNSTETPVVVGLKSAYFGEGVNDEGMTILPLSSEVFACNIGEIYEVRGKLEVTFLRDRSIFNNNFPINYMTISTIFNKRETDSATYTLTDPAKKTYSISGFINIDYSLPTPGNVIGGILKFNNSLRSFPGLVVRVYNYEDLLFQFNPTMAEEDLKIRVNSINDFIKVEVDWGVPDKKEYFYFNLQNATLEQ